MGSARVRAGGVGGGLGSVLAQHGGVSVLRSGRRGFTRHTDNGAQPASAAPPPHHAEVTHSEPLDHSPHSPCGYTPISGSALAGEYEGLTPDRPPLEWFAVDVPVATSLTAVSHTANLALARAAPPPSLRLYRRTQRLLI